MFLTSGYAYDCAGDHIVQGRAAFGSCRWLTDSLLPRFGVETTVIDARDPQQFADAVRPNTKVFFFETPANPTMDVVDLAAVCAIARRHGITSVVDNAFATPALQRPLEFGA
ncbi:aminotransferase class I/II-fold pyridoxal phosphate-dependent enzyme, partial [Burkholderia pseudomallei]|uniref:aminotransferase class I/II-fold pyridoxal phosphate-dependent enzyme n=1 Tax=Burkholderia pseudomallei TaxID=28450 RepID=UPI00358FADFF